MSSDPREPNSPSSGNLPPGFDPSTCRSVYVGNIHTQVTEPFLREVFAGTGPVEGCKLIRKEKSSYGFIQYFDLNSAALAISSLNGRHLFGQPIEVNWAYDYENISCHFKISVSELSPEVTDATLFACFSVYPSFSDARVMLDKKTGSSRGFGFVSFRTQQDARSAINDLTGKWLGSKQIRCYWAKKGVVELTNNGSSDEDGKETSSNTNSDAPPPENNPQYYTTTVYVRNLDSEVTQLDLYRYFHAFGAGVIEQVRVQRDKGFGFVRYSTHSEAALAIQMGNDAQSLVCGIVIKCFYFRRDEELLSTRYYPWIPSVGRRAEVSGSRIHYPWIRNNTSSNRSLITSSDRSLITSSNRTSESHDIILREYEVFLSFRGEDTRASFTSHLYAYLRDAGITVFKDDYSLGRGYQISDSLLRAIEASRIAIVVFSKNYADSQWCLDELVKIMECHRTTGQVVLPVFYHVDPSEVRHQTGEFGEAFQNLCKRVSKKKLNYAGFGKVLRKLLDTVSVHKNQPTWKEVLREAAGLAGFPILNSRNGNENDDIKDIVKKVQRLLDKTDLFVADNPVGAESRVQDMIKLLDMENSNNVLLLGMWGMGGIGKTTIMKAIYNEIGHSFEGRSFIANVRQNWDQNATCLQEQILLDICKEMTTKIQSIEFGKFLLKDRLCRKRVLLLLDDVSTLDQLNALCGSREWFGLGSRIIITTRDWNILRGNRVNGVYKMEAMDERESIELFSWRAFKHESPTMDFAEISRNVVAYCGGLPLALEVIGSYLFDRKLTEWNCLLEKLKEIPDEQVHKKLKISYDGLNYTEQETFLDIACFFIGKDRSDVIHILNGCGLYAEIGISVLVERSLVTVDNRNILGMHDLVRDMGREVIREESPKEPEKRSRLWFNKDVLNVMSEQPGTKVVEGLTLKLPSTSAKRFSTEAFKKMEKLRLLQFAGVQLVGDFEYLSRNLRWLCWNGFPLNHIPTNFYQRNLVSIELENSNVEHLWEDTQMMEKLKILNLSHCHNLKETPDFSNLPNLEKLILWDCRSLSEISHTIGDLNRILLINLDDCVSLCVLPRSIYKLKSLKTLLLSGCSKIDKLEEDLEQMESLTTLIANNTKITIPFSVVRSKSIGYISLAGYEGLSRDVFPSIIWSWMSPMNNLPFPSQTSVCMSSSLVHLDVPNSSSHELSSISQCLPSLQSLWVDSGSELQLSRDAAIILDSLYATISKDFESAATTSQVSIGETSALIQMGINCQVTNILKEIIVQNMNVNGYDGSLLPVDCYPNWLTFSGEGSSVIFDVPQVEGHILKTMMCIVYFSAPDSMTSDGLKCILVKNYTKSHIQLYKREALASFKDEEGQRVVSSTEPGNKVELVVVFGKASIIKKTIVYLIYDDETIEQCHEQDTSVVVCNGGENECAVRRNSSQVNPMGDLNQKRKRRKF